MQRDGARDGLRGRRKRGRFGDAEQAAHGQQYGYAGTRPDDPHGGGDPRERGPGQHLGSAKTIGQHAAGNLAKRISHQERAEHLPHGLLREPEFAHHERSRDGEVDAAQVARGGRGGKQRDHPPGVLHGRTSRLCMRISEAPSMT